MWTRANKAESLAAEAEALSPKRLMLLTGLFTAALAALFIGKALEERESRRTETALLLDRAVADCAVQANVAILTGEPVARLLAGCSPGGATALFHLAANGGALSSAGELKRSGFDIGEARALTLGSAGAAVIDGPKGKVRAVWRPLDNGEAILAAAPAADLHRRTPAALFYLTVLGAVALAVASLMAAFIRQSRSVAAAAGAVEALRQLGGALSAGRTGAWSYDAQNRVITLSQAILGPLGLGARDRAFSLREISALVHPQDLRTALAILTGEKGGLADGVVRFRSPTGDWSRAYFRTAADATRHNRAGVAIDLAGARTLAPSAALAEARLKDAIECIPEAFALWDSHGRIVAWNRRFALIAGIDPTALKAGLDADEVAARASAGGAAIARHFTPADAAAAPSVEVALPEDRWLMVSRRRTADGGVVCVGSNITDVKRRARAQRKRERDLKTLVGDLETSRRELSETMRNYEFEKRRAEDASRSKSEFLANMSHELRTPLNAIKGFSEVMQSELYGPLGDPKYKEYVSDILASGQHLLELIDDILDMSKIEAGRLSLDPKRVELEKTFDECVRLVAKRAADAGVVFKASVAHAPAIFADARAAKQVILNLLSNAIKFTPAGGEVTLTAEADLDCVTVIVADNGVGIAKDALARLGEPFELVEDHFAKSRKGSGLGLALSKSLMELQGGVLALASAPGQGTVACASFPRRKDARVRLPQFIRAEARILTGDDAAPARRYPAAAE